ncbi:MAG: ComF family protein [Alphaproteobacteria bacterium]
MIFAPDSALKAVASGAGRGLANLVLPPTCATCQAPISTTGALCPPCWCAINFIESPICARLGLPLAYDLGPGGMSAQGQTTKAPFDRVRSVAHYDGVARQLVSAFKFGDRLDLAPMIAGWMARAGAQLLGEADVLVPVPLHWSRLWTRRYNQAAQLARALARTSGLACQTDFVRRTRRTRSQPGLTARQRRRNVAGAFSCPPHQMAHIEGRRIILVDDVMTTGATVGAVARALRRNGAARVDVLTFARVVAPTEIPI